MNKSTIILLLALTILYACKQNSENNEQSDLNLSPKVLIADYKEISIDTTTSHLPEKEQKLVPIFREISKDIDDLFWYQSFGYKDSIPPQNDTLLQQLLDINFGPWSRFKNNAPFINGMSAKSPGANFYPGNMTKQEFTSLVDSSKTSPYTFIERNSDGNLVVKPYHVVLKKKLAHIADLFKKAALLCQNTEYQEYLNLRANAFLTDDYDKSDSLWLNSQHPQLDFIAGPIEIYDDQLFGYKAEYESFLFIKDTVLTKEYSKYVLMLPFLQKALPVDVIYRHEDPEYISGLSVANIITYGGASRAGGYSISVTYPSIFNNEDSKNHVIIQFKNIIDAKYENILLPIAKQIIAPEQQSLLSREAFFQNNLFTELGFRLGIKKVLNREKPVRIALKEYATVMNLVKAYSMSLYIAEKLSSVGEITDLMNNYTVFVSEIFRTLRFGESSQYAQSKLIIFNYLKAEHAIKRTTGGHYWIESDKIEKAINKLINEVIVLQGNGDYEATQIFISKYNVMDNELKTDLIKLSDNQLYTDIIIK